MKIFVNKNEDDLKSSIDNRLSSNISESIQNIRTIIRVRPFLKNEFVKYNSVYHHPIVISI